PGRAPRRTIALSRLPRGRAELGTARPGAGSLGVRGCARAVPGGHLGPTRCRCDARTQWTFLEAAVIIDLPDTSTREISKKLVRIREQAGLSTIGRVLTLLVLTDHVRGSEAAIEAANEASREHPCRVIVVIRGDRALASRLDGE